MMGRMKSKQWNAKVIRYDQQAKQHCKGHKSCEKHEGQQGPEGRPEGHVLRRRRPLANLLGFNFA